MKVLVRLCLFAALTSAAIAGPPTLEIETRGSSLSGRYHFESRIPRTRDGTVDLHIQFRPRPEKDASHASFGDASFRVASVSLTIDSKAQKFPAELLDSLGYCAPESLFFSLDVSDDLLMTVDFAAGKERATMAFRIRGGVVSKLVKK